MVDSEPDRQPQTEVGDDQASAHEKKSDMNKRLAELKALREQMEANKRQLDEQLDISRQELNEMKQDVEFLNSLNHSRYQEVEQELKAEHWAAE